MDPHLALLMLKPDAVRQGLGPAVTAWLGARGMTPVAHRRLMLDPRRRAGLYATPRTGGRLDWQLNGVLYDLGPVCAVLLRGTPPDGWASLAEWVSGELKGSFKPAAATPGTMRAELGALNPIFNLVHASDDPAETGREARVLFGADPAVLSAGPAAAPAAGARAAAPPAGAGNAAPVAGAETAGLRPFPLWTTVRAVLRRLGLPGDGDAGWPADRAAASRTALARVSAAWPELLQSLPPGSARLVGGIRDGGTAWPDFQARTVPRGGDAWAAYLTFTTLRYLDLCLEPS